MNGKNGSSGRKRINFDEVHELSLKLAKEPPFTAENLYVDLLLTLTAQDIQSKFEFVLKGGTAILKTWIKPYRFSYDLDFSCYPEGEKVREHYKTFKPGLEKLVEELGFTIVEEKTDEAGNTNSKHREGGRIFILKLMDKSKYLKQPIKLSVSCIDARPCYGPESKRFDTIIDIPTEQFRMLYPEIIPRIQETYVTVLTLEELCAEKIRALATRGPKDEWSFMLRDAVDLYVMEQNGVLDRVLTTHRACIKQKFFAIKDRSYWKKLERFMSGEQDVKIREENLDIFFDRRVIDEMQAARIVQKIRENLKEICDDISNPKGAVESKFAGSSQKTAKEPKKLGWLGSIRAFLRKLGLSA